ncbi:uncharacterized protein ColSpa_03767 [Colletotrichum spaethianum]|uniref:Uncharacterized protein n=1 Tax=Colletotrichum spaethianum TaxID=700344 RepID=A0AA37L7S0_9PEZI|nr:uncharacterized protein ColSpa_03767 [Colletotrichum spaethianum]GKT43586.1 hypothetical protein ColSpa_03767 [Colletotrichum spaethianum]
MRSSRAPGFSDKNRIRGWFLNLGVLPEYAWYRAFTVEDDFIGKGAGRLDAAGSADEFIGLDGWELLLPCPRA